MDPALDQALLEELNEGLVCLSGCSRFGLAVQLECRRPPGARFRPRAVLRRAPAALRAETCGETPGSASSRRRSRSRRSSPATSAHDPARALLQDALVAIRHRTSLEGSEPERRGNHEAILRHPAEIADRFPLDRDAVERTAVIAERCEFELTQELGYRYPDFSGPGGAGHRAAHPGLQPRVRRALLGSQRAQAQRQGPPRRGAEADRRARSGRSSSCSTTRCSSSPATSRTMFAGASRPATHSRRAAGAAARSDRSSAT